MFSINLLLPPSNIQIFSSASCSQILPLSSSDSNKTQSYIGQQRNRENIVKPPTIHWMKRRAGGDRHGAVRMSGQQTRVTVIGIPSDNIQRLVTSPLQFLRETQCVDTLLWREVSLWVGQTPRICSSIIHIFMYIWYQVFVANYICSELDKWRFPNWGTAWIPRG
jgi:hypothetical protein